ncbi:MAG: NUDIX hydrolase [Candidatus Magasanikbacteria bacterium GW2011_GWA2_45_39]|uniref:NUDIX hydrolase n=2 Tax=Candidatus Magasanikiibacteriota TaxID=1752731 RepID=A0A0G1MXB7_9BACT|nr:MAG: NUDIX hydrolase [Candidatus Magasanikbacteria bacterium GW2011_GWA2_45_39]KKU12981.1 MAG: NUDIX hydrolase [Candidatus Magasanikbacteria bacterium GW2011_GWC2_45_8]HBW74246.1 hypothetical protein [Candidatus Magasanikbacteria bacterium]
MNNKKQTPPYGLPPNAKKVFSGLIWDVYQWPQKMFDGTTHTFECLKRVNTAVIIPMVGDKILIQRQLQPHWERELVSLPAGRFDGEEEPLDCAQRELLEETGYVSDNWELFEKGYPYRSMIWERFVFIARDCKKISEQHLDAGERIVLETVSFDKFLNLADHPDWRETGMSILMYQCRLYPEKRRALEEKLFNKI